MKSYTILFSIILLICYSCSKDNSELKEISQETKLDTPSPQVKNITENSFTVYWDKVNDAHSYVYKYLGKEFSTEKNEVIITDLDQTDQVDFYVKAIGYTGDKKIESEWAKITVTLAPPRSKDNFNIETELTDLSWKVSIIPRDNEVAYFYEVVNETIYSDYNYNKENMFSQMIQDYLVYYNNNVETTFNAIHKMGPTNKTFTLPAYESNYYLLVGSIDKNLNVISEVQCTSVKTGKNTSSNIDFKIINLEITQNTIKLQIKPSNNDTYGYLLLDNKSIEKYTENQLRTYIEEVLVKKITPHSGEKIVFYDKNIKPSSEYVLLVFGWQNSHLSTAITRHHIKTLDAQVTSDMKFEFNVNVKDDKVFMKVIPSDLTSSYFFMLDERTEYEKYKNNLKGHFEKIAATGNKTLVWYFRQFSSVGIQQESERIEENKKYVLFAFPVKIEKDDVTIFDVQEYGEDIEIKK